MKNVLMALAIVALIAPAALADDLIPPPWERYTEGTTYQEWDTWETVGPATYVADDYYNPYGIPWAYDYEDGEVWDYLGRNALVMDNGDPLEIYIDNTGDSSPDTWKDIYLQIVWHWDGTPSIPELYTPGTGWTVAITDEFQLEGDWWYTRYHFHIEPNPDYEEIDIWPADGWNLVIDQIVVDTICLPEPATLSLLGFGALALIRRR